MWKRSILVVVYLTVANAVSFGADLVTLTGKVTDVTGRPLSNVSVIVYHAGVRKGYSTFCPSCYADCGKRTTTDGTGTYTIKHLNSDLWFELLVVRDGYAPAFVKRVEPLKGPAATAVLKVRSAVIDQTRMVRGRVVDAHGSPVRDAIVEPQGIAAIHPGGAWYGELEGLDPLAVTNGKGEFEITYNKPTSKMLLLVEARTMAPKFVVMPTGTQRQALMLSEGATIRGRLVVNGKPVGDAEVGLIGQDRGGFGGNLDIVGNPYREIRVGTQEDGSFALTNVPAPVKWYIYAKMESVAHRGATEPAKCATTRDKELVDVGDIQIGPGHRLQGRVVLSDRKHIADGMRIIISSDRAWDSQTAVLGKDGNFEFIGLPRGKYSISPSVNGYGLPNDTGDLETSIDRDVDSFVIVLGPVGRVPTYR